MIRLPKSETGFGNVEAILLFVIVATVGLTGWYVWHVKQTTNTATQTAPVPVTQKKPTVTTPTPAIKKETVTIPAPVDGVTTFKGTVTSDTCTPPAPDPRSGSMHAPIGDVGCSITLGDNNITVGIVHGNIQVASWGDLIGFNSDTDITGKQVEVHAIQVASTSTQFSLSRSDTYVKLLN